MDDIFNISDIDAILPDDFDINNENYSLDNTPAEAPTTEQPAETNDQATAQEPEVAEPTTTQAEPAQPATPQTVKVKFNHEERELSLDEAATYAQKGMNYDKLEEKVRSFEAANARNEQLAKRLGYANASEMIEAAEKDYVDLRVKELVDAGNTEAMARFLVEQDMNKEAAKAKESQVIKNTAPAGMTRERKEELDEFIEAFPGVTVLPQEVIAANRSGVRLKTAYANYIDEQSKLKVNTPIQNPTAPAPAQTTAQPSQNTEIERLRQENQILKQNQASAAMAPVTGVTGKPSTDIVDPLENDPFLKGFNSDQW